jgi:threonyl-tRNA synthetase
MTKTPIILALGKREVAERTVSIRRLGQQHQTMSSLEDAVAALVSEAAEPDEQAATAAGAAKPGI